MAVDAFVIDLDAPKGREVFFVSQFMASPDFDVNTLKQICRDLDLYVSKDRLYLIQSIVESSQRTGRSHMSIVQRLVERNKGWIAIKKGAGITPLCRNAAELVVSKGEEEWYGPIEHPNDTAKWYIRPVFIPHWIVRADDEKPRKALIRWLCFARIGKDVTSIHWRGFSYASSEDRVDHHVQFPYWNYVPSLFEELEELTQTRFDEVNLQKTILYTLWDRFRNDPTFEWADRRIRAESQGVALSAHSGAIVEIEAGGIRNLANAIRQAVETHLTPKYSISHSDLDKLDEIILEKLLRRFGAKSYEFSLSEKGGQKLFRGHIYFGIRPQTSSADSFSHINLFTTWCDDLDQFRFLVPYLGI